VGSRAALGRAKARKNNEFYTTKEMVEVGVASTLADNPGLFRGRTLLLPCDDPDWSEFTRYFVDNFEGLGLARLVSTCYDRHGGRGRYLDLRDDGSLATGPLDGDGDFRSEEVASLRDEADVVISNPPFELARVFLTWLLDGSVDFLFIGPNTLPTTRAFRDAYFAGLVRPVQGTCGVAKFYDPYGNTVTAPVTRYTNMATALVPAVPVDPEEGLASAGKSAAWKQYQTYGNYAARECCKRSTIPVGYSRTLGVPITYLAKENIGYFVLDLLNQVIDSPNQYLETRPPSVKGKYTFARYLIIRKDDTTEVTDLPVANTEEVA